jgi:predicted O-methyltransferase YrrM
MNPTDFVEGERLWSQVDGYIQAKLIGSDPALESALEESERAGLPAIAVSAPQGKLLAILAKAIGAKRILEIGTLGGYSTIWLARSLPPDGRLISLEVDPKHAAVASANVDRAALSERVEIRVGPAIKAFPAIKAEVASSGKRFDFVFIDADKPATSAYFEEVLDLTRPGGLIIVDNSVRHGRLVDDSGSDPNVVGMRDFHDLVARTPGVSATTIQTVGSKGYDGFTVVHMGS